MSKNNNSAGDWFESWFDSNYYHILYQHRDEAEAAFFLDNLIKELSISQNSSILDLACGKGRHSIYLNKKSFKVTGTDLSAESIAFAKQFENESLDFFVHDMREPVQERKFDFIFNLFTSFGYFEDLSDNLKVLKAVHSNLKSGAKLVIDFMNAKKVIRNLVLSERKTAGGIDFDIRRYVKNSFITKEIRFEDKGQFYNFEERVRALTLDDFKEFFKESGFKLEKIFGNYALENFDEKNSDRLVLIASPC
jgi:SAM-dependent methyltransferase